jgi:hypothetical protein
MGLWASASLRAHAVGYPWMRAQSVAYRNTSRGAVYSLSERVSTPPPPLALFLQELPGTLDLDW